ncbi:MAG: phage holin family protein [Verrucomicrobiota bacterium]|nr:phage holin family protein [Verrucomicrobiota bacterium]
MLNNLLALANALAGFFETRISLFARESKTALVHILVLVAMLIGALVLVGTGYIFLIVSVIFAIAHAAGVSWVWVALGAAIVHFVLAGVCGFVAKKQLTKPIFEASLAEVKRDREWLKSVDHKNQSLT